jgi:hypothetical protein
MYNLPTGTLLRRKVTEMTNTDITARLEDVRLDAAALKAEIGRGDLMDSQIYYAGEIVRKVEDLLADLKAGSASVECAD